MNKLKIGWQENELSLNIKFCLLMSSSSLMFEKNLHEQACTFNTRINYNPNWSLKPQTCLKQNILQQ